MQDKNKCNSEVSNSTPQLPLSVVVVHQPLPKRSSKTKETSYYADNLAFSYEEEALIGTRNAGVIYGKLSESHKPRAGLFSSDVTQDKLPLNKLYLWRAAIAGCMLAICIILLYLWVHVQYVNPMFVEVFKVSPTEHPALHKLPGSVKLRSGLISDFLATPPQPKTSWTVDYDLPPGIPLVKLSVEEILKMDKIICPPYKFALALHVEESNSKLAEDWLKLCGHNVAYFRLDGNPSDADVYTLTVYSKDALYFALRATLKVEKGGLIQKNPDFQKTIESNEVINIVEISGFVTAETIQQLIEAVPHVEDITIKGDEVCKGLRRSLRNSDEACKISWGELLHLRIIETQECKGLYDLIYSCWEMPYLEALQIRKGLITSANADYIKNILDRHRVLKVDFADNVCYDDTLQHYPFMCQPSA